MDDEVPIKGLVVTRGHRLRVYRRLRKLYSFLMSEQEGILSSSPQVGQNFVSSQEALSSSRLELRHGAEATLKPISELSAEAQAAGIQDPAVVAYAYDSLISGKVERRTDYRVVSVATLGDPTLDPGFLHGPNPFYPSASRYLFYRGRLLGKHRDTPGFFPGVLPSVKIALEGCLKRGLISKESYDKASNFMLCGTGAHGIREAVNLTAHRRQPRIPWRDIRRVYLRSFPIREFPLHDFTLLNFREYLGAQNVHTEKGVGPIEHICFGPSSKGGLLDCAYLHAREILGRLAQGERIVSPALFRQGRRYKRVKLPDFFSDVRELTGRSVCIADTFDNLVVGSMLYPFKRHCDLSSGTIFSSYSRSHLGYERQASFVKSSTHRFSSDFVKGEFHYGAEAKALSVATLFSHYVQNKGSYAGARYLYSHLLPVNLVFPGGHTLVAANLLPSGVAGMGTIWGLLNRLLYHCLGTKISRSVEASREFPGLRCTYNASVLGDDGCLDFNVRTSNGTAALYGVARLCPDRIISRFFSHLFGFKVDEFLWSKSWTRSLEDKADFLKEVFVDGVSHWRPSQLLNVVATQACSAKRLEAARNSPRLRGDFAVVDGNPDGHYDSWNHWQAIASAGVAEHPDNEWFTHFGASLLQQHLGGKVRYEACLRSCLELRERGFCDVLQRRHISDPHLFDAFYARPKRDKFLVNCGVLDREFFQSFSSRHLYRLEVAAGIGDKPIGRRAARYMRSFGLPNAGVDLFPSASKSFLAVTAGRPS